MSGAIDRAGGAGPGAWSRDLPLKAVRLSAAALLLLQATLLGLSLPRNAVTIDEVCHLPAGISYWHYRQFWCYHHNPPLIRLIFSLPAVLSDVPTDYHSYRYVAGSRGPDFDLGRDFMLLNRKHYLGVYVLSRSTVAAMSVLGGLLVFRWSRELFGDAGGLISLALWATCPDILAHGGLVTPDIGSTVVALLATYRFWHYFRAPSLRGAVICGVLLGCTEASKYTFVILPTVWVGLAGLKVVFDRSRQSEPGLGWRRAIGHGAILGLVSLLVLNDVYLWEGTGRSLGSFEFKSKLMTRLVDPGDAERGLAQWRENRFRGTMLAKVPMPFPEHFLLGFDDQAYDVDGGRYIKYLRGELRREGEEGWWYYYLYCFAVKTPIATLVLLTLAAWAFASSRRCRLDPLSEAMLLVPALAILVLVSSQTGLNSHFRYALPIFPFVFISAGRLGPWLSSGPLGRRAGVAGLLLASAASALAVHPYYLSYFNEAVGGPERGLEHLAEGNIDWGQGLVALKEWLDDHAPGRPIRLAYFGVMYPEVLGIRYKLPPFGAPGGVAEADPRQLGPAPGLQAVSANYLLGIPFSSPDGLGSRTPVPPGAYSYYRRFRPVAIVAHSIYVYDIGLDEANWIRSSLGPPSRRQGNDPDPR